MVLDNEFCKVDGCTLHVGQRRKTSTSVRNDQIRDDWASGAWTLEELSYFWGVKPLSIAFIVRGVERTSESHPSFEVAHS